MGEQKGPEFYDAHLERVGLPLEKSPWRPVYEAAARFIPFSRVVDVGCGTGRLAKLLHDKGHTDYLGFDFSQKRIDEARSYVPEFRFEVADASSAQAQEWIGEAGVVVFLEILEHLHGDLELLASVPSGASVVLSVPNYDSAAHVRSFGTVEEIEERYGSLVRFDARVTHKTSPTNSIFVMSGHSR